MTTPRHVVLNLGMPRSGTTLIQKMLEQGVGFFHQKICEYHPWHPMNGPHLHLLVNTFRHKRVILVRTTRKLDDIIESMRVGVEMGNQHPWCDDDVRLLWDNERDNWARFSEADIDPSVHCARVVIDYSELREQESRDDAVRRIIEHLPQRGVNKIEFDAFLSHHWNRHPVNVGRLMRALGKHP